MQALQNQINQLKLKNEALVLQTSSIGSVGRQVASLKNGKQISFDDLYLNQLKDAKLNRKTESMKRITHKIISNSLNPDLLAEAYFEKANLSCQNSSSLNEQSCLEDIEIVVAQFPESKWAKESLLLLSTVYTKLRRFKEAESVMKIVKSEFLQK